MKLYRYFHLDLGPIDLWSLVSDTNIITYLFHPIPHRQQFQNNNINTTANGYMIMKKFVLKMKIKSIITV